MRAAKPSCTCANSAIGCGYSRANANRGRTHASAVIGRGTEWIRLGSAARTARNSWRSSTRDSRCGWRFDDERNPLVRRDEPRWHPWLWSSLQWVPLVAIVLARDYTRRMTTYKGERNPFWKGGRSVASNGYVLIRVGVDHHLADCRGYAYEHRLVAEAKLNRRLVPKEAVHHINGIKDDNRPENIEVLPTRAHHMVLHRKRVSSRRNPD